VGDFKDGQRDGYGVYIFSHNGGRYEGNWVNGRYEGYGECTWKDGRRYKVCRIRCMLGSGDVKSRADTVFFLQTRASGKRAWPTEKERKRILMEESGIPDSGSRMSPCGTSPCGMNSKRNCISYMLDHACLVRYRLVNFYIIKNMKLFFSVVAYA
jgi:hypothetical protein